MIRDFQKDLFDKAPQQRKSEYVVILDKGDSIMENLKKLIVEHKIQGFFIGLGAVRDPTIAYFDYSSKKYIEKTFKGDFEVVSLVGNLGVDEEGAPIVHAHITIADKNYNVFGGHLVDGIVSITLELIIISVDNITRRLIPEFDLKLIRDAK